jgi:hypothetical protein
MDAATLNRLSALGADIERARAAVAEHRRNLQMLAEHSTRDTVWTPLLRIRQPKPYDYGSEIDVRVSIPYGVVEQQLVYAWQAARRHLANLENEAAALLRPADMRWPK